MINQAEVTEWVVGAIHNVLYGKPGDFSIARKSDGEFVFSSESGNYSGVIFRLPKIDSITEAFGIYAKDGYVTWQPFSDSLFYDLDFINECFTEWIIGEVMNSKLTNQELIDSLAKGIEEAKGYLPGKPLKES